MRAALLIALLPAGCLTEQTCTLLYAPNTLVIHLQGGAWTDGSHQLALITAQRTYTCSFNHPFDPAEAVCSTDMAEIILAEQGGALASITLFGEAPDALDLTLESADALLIDAHLTPDYETDEPNGEGCGQRRYGEITATW